jgi:hypothetical protein
MRFLNQITPFIFAGIAIVAFTFGILLLAYLFMFGAMVGFVLFALNWLRDKFFPTKTVPQNPERPGRIIDSDDWKNL